MNHIRLIVRLQLAPLALCAAAGLAHGLEQAEPDPDQVPPTPQLPRNLDMPGPAARAENRGNMRKLPDNKASTATSAQQLSLSEADLRMLASRGLPVSYNLCSVTQLGGRAAAPVLRGDINNNCVISNVVIGR